MDFYADPIGKELKKIASILPENVRSMEPSKVDRLPDSAFAWPEKRAFPIHTPENILLSTGYFCKDVMTDGYNFPSYVKENLVKAAYVWGLEQEFDKIIHAAGDLFKKQAFVECWGLKEEYKGKEIKKYPLFDSGHIKLASDYFSENYTNYPLTWRVKIAERITKRAQELGVSIPQNSQVKVYSRQTPVDLEKAAYCIGLRVTHLTKQGKHEEALVLAKLAKLFTGGVIKETPNPAKPGKEPKKTGKPETQEALENLKKQPDPFKKQSALDTDKLVDILLKIDKQANLDYVYDKEIPDPFQSVYNELEKTAEDITGEGVINISGDQYKMSELASVPVSAYESALGKDFVTEITDSPDNSTINMDKLAAVLPTLPADEKSTLNLHIKKHVGKKDLK